MKKNKYSKEQLEPIVARCNSLAEVMRELNLVPRGSNYERFRRLVIKEYNIDISHFNTYIHNSINASKGARTKDEFIKDVLIKDGPGWTSHNLKHKIYKFGILAEVCFACGQKSTWNGIKLTLHLDHINGDHRDNRLSNLRILCPNCHSQTDTYCSGGKGKH